LRASINKNDFSDESIVQFDPASHGKISEAYLESNLKPTSLYPNPNTLISFDTVLMQKRPSFIAGSTIFYGLYNLSVTYRYSRFLIVSKKIKGNFKRGSELKFRTPFLGKDYSSVSFSVSSFSTI
jgi:hypothetical protein